MPGRVLMGSGSSDAGGSPWLAVGAPYCCVTFAEAGSFELGTDGPTVILVGVDGSPTSLRACAYAAGLARRQRAGMIVVYVGPLASIAAAMPGVGGHRIVGSVAVRWCEPASGSSVLRTALFGPTMMAC
jgi:Universal stress protein family